MQVLIEFLRHRDSRILDRLFCHLFLQSAIVFRAHLKNTTLRQQNSAPFLHLPSLAPKTMSGNDVWDTDSQCLYLCLRLCLCLCLHAYLGQSFLLAIGPCAVLRLAL